MDNSLLVSLNVAFAIWVIIVNSLTKKSSLASNLLSHLLLLCFRAWRVLHIHLIPPVDHQLPLNGLELISFCVCYLIDLLGDSHTWKDDVRHLQGRNDRNALWECDSDLVGQLLEVGLNHGLVHVRCQV